MSARPSFGEARWNEKVLRRQYLYLSRLPKRLPLVPGEQWGGIPDKIKPDTPLPLKLAAKIAFPTGTMTVSGLRNEIRNGHLQASKVAGRIWTTLTDIKRMMQQCQIKEADDLVKVRNYTCAKPRDQEVGGDGSSSTAPPAASTLKEAQEHLNQIAQQLRRRSLPISPKNTSPTSAKVVRIKS
jgi:hypothetical protein